MNILKKFSAILMAVAIFGSTAFAADVNFDQKIEYATGAETITVNLYPSEGMTELDAFSCVTIKYDTEIYSVASATTTQELSVVYKPGEGTCLDGQVTWSNDLASSTSVITKDPLITAVFNVLDPSKVVGSTFSIDDSCSMMLIGGEMYVDIYPTITVTAATPVTPEPPVDPEEPEEQEPVPGTVGTKDGYTTVVDDDKATRFVVTDTKASIAATAASVLKVTYAGETRQANLYKLLGVENAEELGNVTIGSLTIKMVLPATVQDAASIGAYSFIVE